MGPIIVGTHLFGAVDHVPGVCHVATQFAHVNYVPLLPLRSYIVLDRGDPGSGLQRQRVPLNFKSAFVGYYRGWIGTLAGVLFGFTGLLMPLFLGVKTHPAQPLAMAGGLAAAAALTVFVLLTRSWLWIPAELLLHAASLWSWTVGAQAAGPEVPVAARMMYPEWLPVIPLANIVLAAYSLSRLFDRAGPARREQLAQQLADDPEFFKLMHAGAA